MSASAIASSPFLRVLDDGSLIHVHPLPQVRAQFDASNKLDDVNYHNGPVVTHSQMYAIFWRPAGTYMSAKYESTIELFFRNVGGTAQYNTLTQYYDQRFPILNASNFAGAWTDTSPYPADFNKGGSGDRDLHAEVLKAISVNHWAQGGITPIYVILTASKAPDDGWAACAYHGSFPSNSTTYVYAIVPYQHDYGPHGCGTPSNVWPNDRDADQPIATMWHEQAEATTDPNTSGHAGGWFSNRTGAEIGDLCETTYGPLAADGSDTTLHGHDFVTQEIWANWHAKCYQGQTR